MRKLMRKNSETLVPSLVCSSAYAVWSGVTEVHILMQILVTRVQLSREQ